MKQFLVIDVGCAPCSSLAKEISDLTGLDVRGPEDPEIMSLHSDVRSALPRLVQVDDGVVMGTWSGWRLRLRVARLGGLRSAWRWPGLMLRENAAQATREGALPRRSLLFGAAAGAAAVVLGTNLSPASAAPAAQGKRLSRTDISDLLDRHAGAKVATSQFGPAVSAVEITRDGEKFVAVGHDQHGPAITYLPADELAAAGVTQLFTPGNAVSELYLPDGTPLARFNLETNDTQRMTPATASHQRPSVSVVEPDGFSAKVICFIDNVKARTATCKNDCGHCGEKILINDPLTFLTTIATESVCWKCAACTGLSLGGAAKKCFF